MAYLHFALWGSRHKNLCHYNNLRLSKPLARDLILFSLWKPPLAGIQPPQTSCFSATGISLLCSVKAWAEVNCLEQSTARDASLPPLSRGWQVA